MPEFKNKEEYLKWKAERVTAISEKLKKQKDEQEKSQESKEEEEKLNNLWICPDCLSSNNISEVKCQCGYTANVKYLKYLRGSITPSELYKKIKDYYDAGNDEEEGEIMGSDMFIAIC